MSKSHILDFVGKSRIGTLAKKVETFNLLTRVPRRGGGRLSSAGSKRRFTTAIVVTGRGLPLIEGRWRLLGWVASIVSRPSLPLKMLFFRSFSFLNV